MKGSAWRGHPSKTGPYSFTQDLARELIRRHFSGHKTVSVKAALGIWAGIAEAANSAREQLSHDGSFIASLSAVARLTGYDAKQVRRCADELVRMGLVERRDRPGMAPTWRILDARRTAVTLDTPVQGGVVQGGSDTPVQGGVDKPVQTSQAGQEVQAEVGRDVALTVSRPVARAHAREGRQDGTDADDDARRKLVAG